MSVRGFKIEIKMPAVDQECAQSCPEEWEAFGQQCYFWSNSVKSWNNAEQTCRHKGGNLASVSSHSTNSYILRKWTERGIKKNDALWIGGTDKVQENVWKWSDGAVWQFTYWGSGGRNPSGQGDCLQYFSHDKKWWDWKCHEKYHFVCSKSMCSGNFHHLSCHKMAKN